MRKNVYLLDLGTGTDRGLLPLACGLIAAYAKTIPIINNSCNISIHMLNEGLDELIDDIQNPYVVGVSCYVWNFYGSVEISKRLKERYPEVKIIWGGPSIPAKAHRINSFFKKHLYLDVAVHLEGELTFADLLEHYLSGHDLKDCAGITFRDGKDVITNPMRVRISDFTSIPSPFLTGIFDDLINKYGDYIVGALWETSRGCPFKCSFCDWGNAIVNKVNRLEVDRVLKEIEWASDRGICYIYATDANFGITVKRDLEIAEGFVDISRNNGFPSTLVLNWTKNSSENIIKIAEALYKGGVTTNITLSHQSFHKPTLEAIQRDNIKPAYLRELKEKLHGKNLATYDELILALPEETLETFVEGIEKTCNPHVKDQLNIYLCVVLENTHLQESKERYGIKTRECAVGLNRRRFKYPRFGVDEIVVETSSMPVEDWKKAYEIAWLYISLYNFRVAYFPMLYLKHICGARVTDFVRFVLDRVDENLPSFDRALKHLRNNRQLILDNISSVSPVEGGDGVSLTPDEAMAFLFFTRMDDTYDELKYIIKLFISDYNYDIEDDVIDEIIKYQKCRVPIFNRTKNQYSFDTNIPVIFDRISRGKDPVSLCREHTKIMILDKGHDYKTETEFNLRRVACGYTLNLDDAIMKDTAYIPMARNTNLAGKFADNYV